MLLSLGLYGGLTKTEIRTVAVILQAEIPQQKSLWREHSMCNKVNPHCKGCGHRRPLNHSNNKGYSICYYILDTGEPRKCTIEDCIHYTTKECHIKEDLWKD